MVILDPSGMNFDAVFIFGRVQFYLNMAHHTVSEQYIRKNHSS